MGLQGLALPANSTTVQEWWSSSVTHLKEHLKEGLGGEQELGRQNRLRTRAKTRGRQQPFDRYPATDWVT